jgi:hypothetical protein
MVMPKFFSGFVLFCFILFCFGEKEGIVFMIAFLLLSKCYYFNLKDEILKQCIPVDKNDYDENNIS